MNSEDGYIISCCIQTELSKSVCTEVFIKPTSYKIVMNINKLSAVRHKITRLSLTNTVRCVSPANEESPVCRGFCQVPLKTKSQMAFTIRKQHIFFILHYITPSGEFRGGIRPCPFACPPRPPGLPFAIFYLRQCQ